MGLIYYCAAEIRHAPHFFIIRGKQHQNREVPERAQHLLLASQRAGHVVTTPVDLGMAAISAVHSDRYLLFLERGYDRWAALNDSSDEIIPNVFPIAQNGGYPDHIVGQAGFHLGDMACPINAGTWTAAYGSAQSALNAAKAVSTGEVQHSYALCRPPGHHAYADRASGYCFLNNAAIAAQYLRDNGAKRVSILDVDVHHGNGTQDIFYDRGDVQFVSLHADPGTTYPYFWGYRDQIGTGEGEGATRNLPMPPGTGDEHFVEALEEALSSIVSFRPDAVVVSLGLDTFVGDPYAIFAVTTEGFRRIGAAIGRLALPTVTVQEGGYLCDALGDNLVSFLEGVGH